MILLSLNPRVQGSDSPSAIVLFAPFQLSSLLSIRLPCLVDFSRRLGRQNETKFRFSNIFLKWSCHNFDDFAPFPIFANLCPRWIRHDFDFSREFVIIFEYRFSSKVAQVSICSILWARLYCILSLRRGKHLKGLKRKKIKKEKLKTTRRSWNFWRCLR